MVAIHALAGTLGIIALTVAAVYTLLALVSVAGWRLRKPAGVPTDRPAATVLKPLCGAEPRLYENLRSFCEQAQAGYQIVFGLHDGADPALAVVHRLAAEFPSLAMDVVIDSRQHGSNRKVSNLINMLEHARHDVIIMSDSDAFAGPGYLASVTAPLLDPTVGLVTCPYHDEPTRGIWSRLGAMYVNEWYMPSVLMAQMLGHHSYASGQTLGLRRESLQAIGGLHGIANHLADDYKLGELVRALGLRVVLVPYLLEAEHHEPTLDTLVRHELRWMRTIGVLRPMSFRFIFCTFSLPLALTGLLLAARDPALSTIAWWLLCITLLLRLGLHFVHRLGGRQPLFADLWLLPIRDLLICGVWCGSFFTSRFTWRGSDFGLDADGTMRKFS